MVEIQRKRKNPKIFDLCISLLCFMVDNVQAIHICESYIKLSSKVMIYKFNLFMLI